MNDKWCIKLYHFARAQYELSIDNISNVYTQISKSEVIFDDCQVNSLLMDCSPKKGKNNSVSTKCSCGCVA